jgi:Flp pilus assembly protein TadG
MILRRTHAPRRGVAAVEMALVTMLFIIPMMIGVWEVGRLIQVQQIVSNSAREGARLAGQAYTINSDGSITQIFVSTGTPSVKSTVYQYLVAAGLTNLQMSDVQVDFAFTAPKSDGTTPTEPYLGDKNEPFTITVTIPWAKVRWVNLGIINPTSVTFTVTWQMLIDDKFTVNANLPVW